MRFSHHNIEYVLPDEWWNEAGMRAGLMTGRSYVSGPSPWPKLPVFELAVSDLQPVLRQGSHGVFNNNPEFGTAHDRVVQILRGFREQSSIPPIEVARLPPIQSPQFKLIHGAHRLYCSIAAGFSHVPAVEVVDFFGTHP
jgi:hypothetical protein